MTRDWAALAANPIRPDQPCGESVLYDPSFESLKAEIGKLDSLQGQVPDWTIVVDRGAEILQDKSKDLTVAGYLTLALFRDRGYPGLAQGISVLRTLLDQFWDGLYPEIRRMRARAAALNWVNDKVHGNVSNNLPSAADFEVVTACLTGLRELIDLIGNRFEQDAPTMGDLRRALEEAARGITPAPQAPKAAPAPTAGGAGTPSVIDSPDSAYKALRAVSGEGRRIVEFLVRNEPASPVPYLVSRGLAWSSYRELPQDREGVTMLGAPEAALVQSWERMLAQREWKPLLEDTEWRLLVWPLFLDLNFLVASALSGLGFDPARAAMVDQCLGFVRRFPRLLELKFQDGRALASDETRAWLEAERRAQAGSGPGDRSAAGGPAGGAGAEDDGLAGVARSARALANRGKIQEAIVLVQEGMVGLDGRRNRFRARLALAEICLEAGQPAGAAALLEALDEEMIQHRLEEWEPALAVSVLKSLYLCERRLGKKGMRESRENTQRLERIYGRLCRLDLPVALALSNSS